MPRGPQKNISFDFYARLIILSYAFLQVLHWCLFPLYMDIYYHLHTAWGFIQAGGYSGWDFWEFAPFGRPHIYPPVFHIILALFMKLGLNSVLLAKSFETLLPVLFLCTVWFFLKNNYGKELGLFVLITLSSSFSFYLSLLNHLPATLALIFGILALHQLLQKSLIRSLLLLVLCFYTHIGVSWFFAISFIIFAVLDTEVRKPCLIIAFLAIALSMPLALRQLSSLEFIKAASLYERYLCEFKTIDYILALGGLLASWKLAGKFRLFFSLFIASLIFLIHPYRFFSAEGFIAIAFLSAICLNEIYMRFRNKKGYGRYLTIAIAAFVLLVSPTVLMQKRENNRIGYKAYFFDSALMGMILPDYNKRVFSTTLWFPDIYLPAAALIKENSGDKDIIYSNLANVSVSLASISGRAASNGLLPEVNIPSEFDPLRVSKIIIFTKDEDPGWITNIAKEYRLSRIGENKIFILYKNELCNTKADIKRAVFPFWSIWLVLFLFALVFGKAKG